MASCRVEKLRSEVPMGTFRCGKESIDEKVYDAYYSSLLKFSQAYSLVLEETVVGYFMFSFRTVQLDSAPESVQEFESSQKCFGVLFVDFLAIESRYQGQTLGKRAMGIIIKRAKEISRDLPIRLLTFEATTDNVNRYKNWGFEVFGRESDGYTVQMFMDLMTDSEHEALVHFAESGCF